MRAHGLLTDDRLQSIVAEGKNRQRKRLSAAVKEGTVALDSGQRTVGQIAGVSLMCGHHDRTITFPVHVRLHQRRTMPVGSWTRPERIRQIGCQFPVVHLSAVSRTWPWLPSRSTVQRTHMRLRCTLSWWTARCCRWCVCLCGCSRRCSSDWAASLRGHDGSAGKGRTHAPSDSCSLGAP